MDLKILRNIAEYINMDDMVSLVDEISSRSQQANCELMIPLVGEFSSGKTSLINALTDSKKLETATKPTTATIYKIHFGSEKCYAKVLNADGTTIEYQDIAELRNEGLGDVAIVDVYDTSRKVPPTTVLIDTPGLSSADPRHRQALVNFLPQADAILLVTDVNQQLTRSITDFIRTMELAKRPIFLVLTKCDTKPGQDLENVRKYIGDNIQLPIKQTVCVSAVKDELQELFTLFDRIQAEKTDIVKQVDKLRIQNVIKNLLARIEDLLNSSSSDKDMESAIRQQEIDLKRMNRNIDNLVTAVSEDVEEIGRKLSRKFEDTVSDELERVVANRSDNFDTEAISVINNTASLLLNDYRDEIQTSFRKKAKERQGKEDSVSLEALKSIDLSSLSITELNYNLNLNALGHQYDDAIATTTKIAVELAAAETGIPIPVSSNTKIVESMVGFVTDKTMGKPQRKRAINNYMEETLAPGFKKEMGRINNLVISSVAEMLHREAADTIAQKKTALEQLRKEYNEKKSEYEKRISRLRDYRNLLITL